MSDRGPLQDALHASLSATFEPSHLDVINESSNHTARAGAETHLKVIVISERFAGQSLLQRHRAVHSAAVAQLSAGVHALSIQALTPAEWTARGESVPPSPLCPKS